MAEVAGTRMVKTLDLEDMPNGAEKIDRILSDLVLRLFRRMRMSEEQ